MLGRVFTFLVASVLTVMAVKRVAQHLKAAGIKVKAQKDHMAQNATKLRQDPKTGIYYPEN